MIPSSFQMLSNECLPEVWRNYPSWPGAIAMMAATFIFFIEYIALSSTHNDKHETLPTHTTQKNGLDHSDDSTAEEDTHHSRAHAHGTLVLLTSKSQTIGIIILELGICFHSIIIGMALSVATGSDFVSLLVALVFHQV
jgi:zinc transporter 1/2/3